MSSLTWGQQSAPAPSQQHASGVGPGSVIVQSMFGGQIFGFDIDQNGTEGILTEAFFLPTGKLLAAVETFDQSTGKILRVVKKIQGKDDFITLGIVGNGIGLVEREHVKDIFVDSRIYSVLDPLSSKKFTGTWTPPLTKDDIMLSVSRLQGTSKTAFLYFQNGGDDHTFVLGSDVAANTFGPQIALPDNPFFFSNSPSVAYDSKHNRAVVAASDGAVGGPAPVIALVNLTTGKVNTFLGVPGPPPFRQGFINGLAVDSEDGIACTTTEVDFRVEFYDLKKKNGFAVVLPGATGQLQSGTDVQFDPIHKLFLVAQSVSSTGPGSSIQVYDIKGNLVESLDGFNFSNAGNVVRTHIAINPTNRTGYVDGPDPAVTQLQSFTY
ncbi:MAG: hypothetical protein HY010_04595 [Acidobacteria bacterium]|nr:hypothetical protein [Acidobacteriota bacterium]